MLDSHPESSHGSGASSSSTITILTARNGSQRTSKELNSKSAAPKAKCAETSASSTSLPAAASHRLASLLLMSGKALLMALGGQQSHVTLPAGVLDTELATMSAASSEGDSDRNRHANSKVGPLMIAQQLMLGKYCRGAYSCPGGQSRPVMVKFPLARCLEPGQILSFPTCTDRGEPYRSRTRSNPRQSPSPIPRHRSLGQGGRRILSSS